MTTLLQHAGFILAMAGVVCVTLYILGPQTWRALRGDDPFEKPIERNDDWRTRR